MKIGIKVSQNWFLGLFESAWIRKFKANKDQMELIYLFRKAIDDVIAKLEEEK